MIKPNNYVDYQELHCCGCDDKDVYEGKIDIRFEDGGGGEYLVINMTEWSVDSIGELDMLFEEIKVIMKERLLDAETKVEQKKR